MKTCISHVVGHNAPLDSHALCVRACVRACVLCVCACACVPLLLTYLHTITIMAVYLVVSGGITDRSPSNCGAGSHGSMLLREFDDLRFWVCTRSVSDPFTGLPPPWMPGSRGGLGKSRAKARERYSDFTVLSFLPLRIGLDMPSDSVRPTSWVAEEIINVWDNKSYPVVRR